MSNFTFHHTDRHAREPSRALLHCSHLCADYKVILFEWLNANKHNKWTLLPCYENHISVILEWTRLSCMEMAVYYSDLIQIDERYCHFSLCWILVQAVGNNLWIFLVLILYVAILFCRLLLILNLSDRLMPLFTWWTLLTRSGSQSQKRSSTAFFQMTP
jgi:hypothetical protein